MVASTPTTQVIRAEPFPDLGDRAMYPRLSESKLAWLAEQGHRKSFAPGDVLYEHAVRDAPFFVLERGLVEFVERKPGKDVHVAQADGGTFIGDIAAFTIGTKRVGRSEPTAPATTPQASSGWSRRACAMIASYVAWSMVST